MEGSSGNNNTSHEYEKQLSEWIVDEKAAIEFITVVGKLWFDKSVELVLFRNQLIERSASEILHKHRYCSFLTYRYRPVKCRVAGRAEKIPDCFRFHKG